MSHFYWTKGILWHKNNLSLSYAIAFVKLCMHDALQLFLTFYLFVLVIFLWFDSSHIRLCFDSQNDLTLFLGQSCLVWWRIRSGILCLWYISGNIRRSCQGALRRTGKELFALYWFKGCISFIIMLFLCLSFIEKIIFDSRFYICQLSALYGVSSKAWEIYLSLSGYSFT